MLLDNRAPSLLLHSSFTAPGSYDASSSPVYVLYLDASIILRAA